MSFEQRKSHSAAFLHQEELCCKKLLLDLLLVAYEQGEHPRLLCANEQEPELLPLLPPLEEGLPPLNEQELLLCLEPFQVELGLLNELCPALQRREDLLLCPEALLPLRLLHQTEDDELLESEREVDLQLLLAFTPRNFRAAALLLNEAARVVLKRQHYLA